MQAQSLQSPAVEAKVEIAPAPCSRLALAAYALGLIPVLGVVALPLGAVALWRIARGRRVGRPVAWGAMGLGALWGAGIGWWISIQVSSGRADYEDAALAELRSIRAAQLAFRDARVLDADGDGRGEFADFARLAGRPDVSLEFRKVLETGEVRRFGYCFRLYQPVGTDAQEAEYLVYAWPESHGRPAVRAFLLHGRTGRLYHCSNGTHVAGRYSGAERQPLPIAAFDPGPERRSWPAPDALPGVAPADGEDWAPLE